MTTACALNRKTALSVRGLTVDFRAEEKTTRVLHSFGYELAQGETLAVVGESGCGKTVHALSIMGLLDPAALVSGGEIIFDGKNLLASSPEEMRAIRGGRISMIFQDPMTSLNPVMPIGAQIAEAITAHYPKTAREAAKQAVELLDKVGIPNPDRKAGDYPHQFSGGMRQRVMIAMALACKPEILIADEPTTALDVTIQAQILELIKSMQKETGMSVLLITHNMGIVADIADRVIVAYAGRCAERAPAPELFKNPRHPYTCGLLNSIPPLNVKKDKLSAIAGQPPAPGEITTGCPFAPRCPKVMPQCGEKEPEEFSAGPEHYARCWLLKDKNNGRP